MVDIYSRLGKLVVRELIDVGLIDDRVERDNKVRVEYNALRKKGISGKKAREVLAERYFIGEKTIQSILYTKIKKGKKYVLRDDSPNNLAISLLIDREGKSE